MLELMLVLGFFFLVCTSITYDYKDYVKRCDEEDIKRIKAYRNKLRKKLKVDYILKDDTL